MGAADSRVAEDLKNSGENEPSDGVLLSQLIQLLSRRQKHCLLLSDLSVLLPSSLRKRAKDHGGLKKWIQIYHTLFQVTGEPGKELVILAINSSSASDKFPEPTKTVDSPGQSEPQQEPDPTPGGEDVPEQPGPLHMPRNDEVKLSRAEVLVTPFDEEKDGHLAIQLRGLPYKATVEDIRNFLGSHAKNLLADNPVHLIMNRDGRPSGFARVVFASEEAARKAREELHLCGMEDRYVEVFLYPDRPSKGRSSRRMEEGATERPFVVGDVTGVTRESIVAECRTEMSKPGNRRILLSMLGVSLSGGARAFLKQADQGLKHFLANYPGEFSIDGTKGCEYVVYTPFEESSKGPGIQPGDMNAYKRGDDKPPGSPSVTPGQQEVPSSNRVVATPSDWGTPAPGTMTTQTGNNWNPPPWPGSNGVALAGGDANGGQAWQGNQWSGQQPPAPDHGQQQQPPPPPPPPPPQQWQGWQNQGAGFNAWGDTASIEAAAQQGAAAATAMSFGLDPQAIAAAVFYGATAAAMAAAAAQQNNAQSQAATQGYAGAGMSMPQTNGFAGSSMGGIGNDNRGGATMRLRGLPYQSTEQDVLAFFAQHDVVDRIDDRPKAVCLLTRSNGRPSGSAIVSMRDRSDAELAQRILNGQWMGNRYIEVFLNEDGTGEAQQSTLAVATAAATAAGKYQQAHQNGNSGTGTMGSYDGSGSGRPWQQPNMWGQGQMLSDNSGQNGDWQALFSFLGDAQQNGATARTGLPGMQAPNNENVNGASSATAV